MTVSAWGQETIFHYVYSGAGTAPAVGETLTATGGTILVERSENSTKTLSTESFTYDSSVPADMKITGGTKAIKFGTSDVWFKLELTDGVFKSGDIISIDTGARLDGFCSDAAITLGVGKVSDEAQRLMDVTKKSLYKAIGQVKPGNRLGDVQHAVETFAISQGMGVVRDYCGHGIGRNMHEEPSIPNFGKPGTGPLLEKGMVLAIEPMLTAGTFRVRELDDGWTVVTRDGSYAAHFEHTVAVTANGSEIFTAFE